MTISLPPPDPQTKIHCAATDARNMMTHYYALSRGLQSIVAVYLLCQICHGAILPTTKKQALPLTATGVNKLPMTSNKHGRPEEPPATSGSADSYERCKCANPMPASAQMAAASNTSYIIVAARVVRKTMDDSYTRNGSIPQFEIANYILQATVLYKGTWPAVDTFFQAQGFVHGDVCGIAMHVGSEYWLDLGDPQQISPSNIWRAGIFVVGRCHVHAVR